MIAYIGDIFVTVLLWLVLGGSYFYLFQYLPSCQITFKPGCGYFNSMIRLETGMEKGTNKVTYMEFLITLLLTSTTHVVK